MEKNFYVKPQAKAIEIESSAILAGSENGAKSAKYDMISADPTGDTAVSLWGSNWRTPTSSEYSALISNCDWTWCDGTSVQYVAGCKLPGWKVSGRDSYSESHIFLPLSGLRDQSRNYVETLGTRACYWSSNTGYYLNLYTSSKTIYAADNGHGMTVRAVLAE